MFLMGWFFSYLPQSLEVREFGFCFSHLSIETPAICNYTLLKCHKYPFYPPKTKNCNGHTASDPGSVTTSTRSPASPAWTLDAGSLSRQPATHSPRSLSHLKPRHLSHSHPLKRLAPFTLHRCRCCQLLCLCIFMAQRPCVGKGQLRSKANAAFPK